MARCPSHDDRQASLSVTEGDDRRALLHCHAGCVPEAIVAALDLQLADLFERPDRPSGPETTYRYVDEQGRLLFEVVRRPGKQFVQRRPDGAGWTYNLNGTRRVLYRLAELAQDDARRAVFVVEGEKDADRLRELGMIATTNPGGAGKWRAEYAEHLRGRHVVVLPDDDEPGRRHAADVARSLHSIAADVRIVELPGVREKGDVSDWLDAGGTVEELAAPRVGQQLGQHGGLVLEPFEARIAPGRIVPPQGCGRIPNICPSLLRGATPIGISLLSPLLSARPPLLEVLGMPRTPRPGGVVSRRSFLAAVLAVSPTVRRGATGRKEWTSTRAAERNPFGA